MTGDADETCASCGDAIVTEEWYPVAVRYDETGDIELYDFCSESCKEQWQSERADAET